MGIRSMIDRLHRFPRSVRAAALVVAGAATSASIGVVAMALSVGALTSSASAQASAPPTTKPQAPNTAQPTTPPAKPAEPKREAPPAKPAEGTGAQPASGPAEFEYVLLTTSEGDILLELNKTAAPLSVANFLNYVDKKFYNGTVFHRVMKGFVVQGGGFDENLRQKAAESPIKNEWKNGLKNTRGTIAMARTGDADSATSQFYFNLKDNTALDSPSSGGAAYAVFGRVAKGMDIVDKISSVPTGRKPVQALQGGGHINATFTDVPQANVTVKEAKRLSAEEAKKQLGS